MTHKQHDNEFLDRVKANLDAAEEQLDEHTRSRLTSIRHEALERGQVRRPPWIQWLLPAGGLAVAVTVAALSVNLWTTKPVMEEPLSLEDMALLSDSEGPEFYEDLDFYQWLAEEEQNAG
jgi:hypothetical protein